MHKSVGRQLHMCKQCWLEGCTAEASRVNKKKTVIMFWLQAISTPAMPVLKAACLITTDKSRTGVTSIKNHRCLNKFLALKLERQLWFAVFLQLHLIMTKWSLHLTHSGKTIFIPQLSFLTFCTASSTDNRINCFVCTNGRRCGSQKL